MEACAVADLEEVNHQAGQDLVAYGNGNQAMLGHLKHMVRG